jgi:hypothetical protein
MVFARLVEQFSGDDRQNGHRESNSCIMLNLVRKHQPASRVDWTVDLPGGRKLPFLHLTTIINTTDEYNQ